MDNAAALAAAADGDQGAWDLLVERHTRLLWSIARSFRLGSGDAADAVQMTWLRLVENLGRIQDPEALSGWLASTLRRECLQVIRRTERQRLSSWDDRPDPPEPGPPAGHGLLIEERNAALWRALDALPEACRRLLRVLMATPPPPYGLVSQLLDLPVGSIGPTRQRCLRRLRDLVREDPVIGPDWTRDWP